MRARLVFSVLAASGFALAAALVTTPSAQAAECDAGKTVRIPHMTSFSGAAADWGELMFKGAVIGAEMINDRGGLHGRCLEFYRADAPYDDKPASVTMFKKLARNPNIPLVFDGGAGTVIFATHDLATQHKVPYYAFSSGGNWPGEWSPWIFRQLPKEAEAVPILVPLLKKKFNIKKAGMIWSVDDEAMVARANAMRKAAEAEGIEVIEAAAKGKDTDYSAQLTRLKAADVQLIVTAQQAFDGGLMVKQAREMGMNQPILAGPGGSADDYWRMSQGKVENTFFYGLYNPLDPRPWVKEMQRRYKEKYGEEITTWAAITTDGALTMGRVINWNAEDLTRDGIRRAFAKTGFINTLGGNVGWAKAIGGQGKGEAIRESILILTWKDGKVIVVPPEFWDS
jgi:branched-chain amino acid transport system substrate-binding protein